MNVCGIIARAVAALLKPQLDAIQQQLRTIMTTLADIQTAEAALQTDLTAVLTQLSGTISTLQAQLAAAQAGDDPAALDSVAAGLAAMKTQVDAVLTPPAPPPPVTGS
jgi:prefoldin subunit 5